MAQYQKRNDLYRLAREVWMESISQLLAVNVDGAASEVVRVANGCPEGSEWNVIPVFELLTKKKLSPRQSKRVLLCYAELLRRAAEKGSLGQYMSDTRMAAELAAAKKKLAAL